jgi:adenine-specific DNA-methyltransferase
MKLIKKVYHYETSSTEEVGILTEKVICDILSIPFNTQRQNRCDDSSYVDLKNDVRTTLGEELNSSIGKCEHVGQEGKECDFVSDKLGRISVKTNFTGNKVCPQNIGQPSLKSFNKYFKTDIQDKLCFKTYFVRCLPELLVEYIKNVFVCDTTIMFLFHDGVVHVIRKNADTPLQTNIPRETLFTTKTVEEWMESNTIKIRTSENETMSLGEIQVHNNRDSLKFRFHLDALLKMIGNGSISGLKVQSLKMQNKYCIKMGEMQVILPKSFNYIGSKIKLLPFIENAIQNYTCKSLNDIHSFLDCFSGTGVVGYYMMQKGIKNIISNDIQHYAEVVSSVWTTKNIDVKKVKEYVTCINTRLSEIREETLKATERDFVLNNYTNFKTDRMYFTQLNGYKIDIVRQHIEDLKNGDAITVEEYKCLLKILLYAVTSVSNIASVYGAYLKKFKKSALKDLQLDVDILNWLIDDNDVNHISYNNDIHLLLDTLDTTSIECAYLDSPYNNRGYHDNYHVLESISRYDYPELKGKTGLRNEENTGARMFTSKTTTEGAFKSILDKLKTKYIFISYNSESIVTKEQMIKLLMETGWDNVQCIEHTYSRFKSNKNGEQAAEVVEYLFCGTRFAEQVADGVK